MPKHVTCACPTCQRSIAMPATLTPGQRLRCPHCKQSFLWPVEDTATRTLEQGPAATATSPRVSADASHETAVSNADADRATLTLDPQHAAKATSSIDAPTPKKIGRFEIRRVLGEGGFGIVYEAYDPQLDRAIALKVAKLGGDSEQRIKRFLREAKSAANLRHPHIVPLFEFGQDGDQFYLALAYIPGQSLDHVLSELNVKKEKMECRRAATLVRHLAEALAYAHGLGIVHRDIKPHNVMLDERGDPLLMDFGLAAREMDEKLTREGAIMGTAAYLAPEQYRGEPTAASDQYSLGVTLYELLTGETPFAGPPDVQIYNHVHTEPESPRKRNPAVTRDLETICLKCLEKDAAKRYADCRALADELRRWLDGEPILARPIGVIERVGKWCHKNPLSATMAASLAAVIVIAFSVIAIALGVVVWQLNETTAALAREEKEKEQRQLAQAGEEQQRKQRALAQVNALSSAAPGAVPRILEELEANRDTVLPRLRERFAEELDQPKRMRLALALLPVEPEKLRDALAAWMLQVDDPAEVLLLRDTLAPHKDALLDRLWTAVEKSGKGTEHQRLRAAAALAKYDPESEKWAKIQEAVSNDLVNVPAVYLATWMESLRPVRVKLLAPLSVVYGSINRREVERSLATDILIDYAADQPQVLADLVMDADERQFGLIFAKLKDRGEDGLALLLGEVSKQLPPNAKEEAKESLAKRQANAAVALLRINQPEKVWPLLKHSPDPRVRSYLIHHLYPMGADAGAIVERLDKESDVTIRRALLLSLGEYGDKVSPEARKAVLAKVQGIYRTESDPGLHGSSEWLLRTWKEEGWLKQVNEEWTKDKEQREKRLEEIKQLVTKEKEKSPPQWYVNGQGQTMVVIPGPVEFVMGSPTTENRVDADQHKRRISRTFAIGAKSVTLKEYRDLTQDPYLLGAKYIRSPDLPVVGINWHMAASYCNMLSKAEGIEKEEWCYEMKGKVMELRASYLSLTGYRLPTEAEMEYATRAGALTSRYYGETDELLGNYAWYVKNSNEELWPVGMKKPNEFGLFDMQGNCFTWCQDYYELFPKAQVDEAVEDTGGRSVIISLGSRVLRGGMGGNPASGVRSAYRFSLVPTNRSSSVGFRLSRTLPLGSFTALPPDPGSNPVATTLLVKNESLTDKDPGWLPTNPKGDPLLKLVSGNPHKVFTLNLMKGDKVIIRLRSKDMKFDPLVALEDSKKNIIAYNGDEDYQKKILDSKLVVTIPADGEYRLIATCSHEVIRNKHGEFHLTVEKTK